MLWPKYCVIMTHFELTDDSYPYCIWNIHNTQYNFIVSLHKIHFAALGSFIEEIYTQI